MKVFQGKSVFNGIAIGKIRLLKKGEKQVKRYRVENSEQEIVRFENAKGDAVSQLAALYEKALTEVGESGAAIFEIHQMMLDDEDYLDSVYNIIRTQKVNAEYAVATTGDNFASMFSSMEDEYMRERAADVKDISERLLTILSGGAGGADGADDAAIIVAMDLAPSETVQMDKDKVLSFVTVKGSVNSHTAILARTMGIPALVRTGLELDDELDGKLAIVDANTGNFYIEPDEELLADMTSQMEQEKKNKELLALLKREKSVTLDNKSVMLYANIGNIKDLALVLQNGAEGIGLFRSEFIYLEKDNFPTEEEQFLIYKTVAETMAGKRVVIRTLDIGADKQAGYFNLAAEENPAMGLRAIRICLTRPEIFKTQLRALYRASAFGKISIMYPMITSVEEVKKIKEISGAVREELKAEGFAIGDVEEGIMIETPAAVMISDLLAKEVDFFSIGTNDLTQYSLAIDRQNQELEAFFDPHHKAVLRMIKMTIGNAHAAGIWCGICGELGADTRLTQLFLAMGIDELSVSPGSVLTVRNVIRNTDTSSGREELINKWI